MLKEVDKGKLEKDILDAEIGHLQKMGITFSLGTSLSDDGEFFELRSMNFGVVFLACGVTGDNLRAESSDASKIAFAHPTGEQENERWIFKDKDLSTREVPLIKAIAAAIDTCINNILFKT